MESIFMLKQEPNTKDTGKMICSMDQVQKYMQMAINIKECLNKEKEMGRVLIIQLMELFTKDNGLMVEYRVEEYVFGKMVESIKVHGQIIKSTGMESTHGQMGENTKEITKMIKSMELELILGQMEENIQGNGKMIKGMAEDSML